MNKAMGILTTLMVAAVLVAPGNPAQASAHATAPAVVASGYDEYFVPYTASEWLSDLTSAVDLPEHVSFVITDVDNCGSELSKSHTGGGCTHKEHGHTTVDISPTGIFTEASAHIVYHEIAHVLGIRSECGAEYFAHKYSQANIWSYPSCKRGVEPYGK